MPAEQSWKPLELVKVTADYLSGKGILNARLDAEILLCRALGLEKRIDLYARFEQTIPPDQLAAFREKVKRRANREPVSRILGEREFMGLRMQVNPAVLSPRPETELLVEAVLEFLRPKPNREEQIEALENEVAPVEEILPAELEKILDGYAADSDSDDLDENDSDSPPAESMTLRQAAQSEKKRTPTKATSAFGAARDKNGGATRTIRILDLGTGSGCIAIALAAMCPEAAVTAVDISPDALSMARQNATLSGVSERVEFRQGNWLAACRDGETFDVIVSNPPYLIEGDPDIWPEVSGFDPALALYGGADGLDAYRAIALGATTRLRKGGKIFLEVGAGQAEAVKQLLHENSFGDIAIAKDYAGIERVVSGTQG